ncbi:MAG: prenyltransferase [Coriobacteriales bacterium]|nr:prenyltransferase [Coriobacteriales bacterium]
MTEGSYKPFTLKAAVELAAPPTWVAAIMPVLVGAAAALLLSGTDAIRWLGGPETLPLILRAGVVLVLMLLTSTLMQAAANTINDYHDFLAGTDTADTVLDTHDASIVYNSINPRSALRFGIALLACAALCGLAVVALSGWPLLVAGLIAAAVLVFYGAGPLPLSYLPLGEALSGIVMGGFITGATYYALTLSFTPLALIAAVPPIITIALIMQVNNTCDIERDIKAGRRTLPVILGRARSVTVMRVLAWATPAWMVLMLGLAAILLWGSLLLLFVDAIVAGCVYFLLRSRLDRIAAGPYDLVNRGAMMGNITAFCRLANLAWMGALLLCWLLIQLMLGGLIGAV